MSTWNQVASDTDIEKTIASLASHNISGFVVANGEEAKAKVLEMIPKGDQVMTMTSVTLATTGIEKEINESGVYEAVHAKLSKMDRATQGLEMQQLGAAPQWAIGSVHAVTMQGEVMIASNTGSQLPAYAYGASHVVWVVGAQKIVKDKEEGMKRLYEYCLPLESKRAHTAYGVEKSAVNKILMIDHEVKPERITLIFVKEVLGF